MTYEVFKYNHNWLALERAPWIKRVFGRYYEHTRYVYWHGTHAEAMKHAVAFEVAHRRGHYGIPAGLDKITVRSDNRKDIFPDIQILGQQRANARRRRRRW